jgi:hypothetical protein
MKRYFVTLVSILCFISIYYYFKQRYDQISYKILRLSIEEVDRDLMQHLTISKSQNPPTLRDLTENKTDYFFAYHNLKYFLHGYASATIPLILANFYAKSGPILEMGMNQYTSYLLDQIAIDYERKLVSIEINNATFFKFAHLESDYHFVRLLDTSELVSYGEKNEWSIVFIDHPIASFRATNVIRFAQNAQIVIAHDAEDENELVYHYKKRVVLAYYTHSCKYTVYKNSELKQRFYSSLILSNFVNLKNMISVLESLETQGYAKLVCKDF